MMKSIFFMLVILLTSNLAAQDWTDKTRILPDELRKIPVAIYIIHDPNPNYPELTKENDRSDSKYVWRHSTSLYSPKKNLTVFQAGSYIWYNEEGWKKNVNFDRRTFAKQFECPKGQLQAGETYTFAKNYRWGNNLYGGDALWHVLAKDEDGNIYKGIGLLETESELLKK